MTFTTLIQAAHAGKIKRKTKKVLQKLQVNLSPKFGMFW